MLYFIIYEDEKKFVEKYKSVINKFIRDASIAYQIINITSYNDEDINSVKNLSGNKIYILDIEVPGKSGLDLAREIRKSGDWKSQIIVSTSHDDLKNFDYQSSILMLAFITKFYNLELELYKNISTAYNILTLEDCITFEKDLKIYNIPKNDILYFEKLKEETYSSIVTKSKRFLTNKTLIKWEEILKNDPRYIKTHRNYLVNIYNIRKIDLEREEICFENNVRVLLSRNYKKEVKEITKILEEEEIV